MSLDWRRKLKQENMQTARTPLWLQRLHHCALTQGIGNYTYSCWKDEINPFSRKRFRSSNKVNNYYNHPIEIHPKHSLFAQRNVQNALWRLPGRPGVLLETQRCGRLPWESGCSQNDTVVQVCLVRAPFIWTQSSSKTHWWIRLSVSHSVSWETA